MFRQKPTSAAHLRSKFLDERRSDIKRVRSVRELLHADARRGSELIHEHRDMVWALVHKVVHALSREKNRRSTLEELCDSALYVLEHVLVVLRKEVREGWKTFPIHTLVAKLLHPDSHLRVRKAAVRLLVLLLAALGEDSCSDPVIATFSAALDPALLTEPLDGDAWFVSTTSESDAPLPRLAHTFLSTITSLCATPSGTGGDTASFLFLLELWTDCYLTQYYPAICSFTPAASPRASGDEASVPRGGRRRSPAKSVTSVRSEPQRELRTKTLHDVIVRWYMAWLLQAEYAPIRAALFRRQAHMDVVHGIFGLSLCCAPGPVSGEDDSLPENQGYSLPAARRIISVYKCWMHAAPIVGGPPEDIGGDGCAAGGGGGDNSADGGAAPPRRVLPSIAAIAGINASVAGSVDWGSTVGTPPSALGRSRLSSITSMDDDPATDFGVFPPPAIPVHGPAAAAPPAPDGGNSGLVRARASTQLWVPDTAALQEAYTRLSDNTALVFQLVHSATSHEDRPLLVDLCFDALLVYQLITLRQLSFMSDASLTHLAQSLLDITRCVLGSVSSPGLGSETPKLVKELAGPLFECLLTAWCRINVASRLAAPMWQRLCETTSMYAGWPNLVQEWDRVITILSTQLAVVVGGDSSHATASRQLSDHSNAIVEADQLDTDSGLSDRSPTPDGRRGSFSGSHGRATLARLFARSTTDLTEAVDDQRHSVFEPNPKDMPDQRVTRSQFIDLTSLFRYHSHDILFIWTNALAILGNVNKIEPPRNHKTAIFAVCRAYRTIRNAVSKGGHVPTPWMPHFLNWMTEACVLGERFKEGRCRACEVVCQMMLERDRVVPSQDDLLEFYKVILKGLRDRDRDVLHVIVKYCSQFYTYDLPGATILIFDFIAAARSLVGHGTFDHRTMVRPVTSEKFTVSVPRLEAVSLIGSLVCYPLVYRDISLPSFPDLDRMLPGQPLLFGSRKMPASKGEATPRTPTPTMVLSAPETPIGAQPVAATQDDSVLSSRSRAGGGGEKPLRLNTLGQKELREKVQSMKRLSKAELLSTPNRRRPATSSSLSKGTAKAEPGTPAPSPLQPAEPLTFQRVCDEAMSALRAVAIEETDCSETRARALCGLSLLGFSQLINGDRHGIVDKNLDVLLAFLRFSDEFVGRTAVLHLSMFRSRLQTLQQSHSGYVAKILRALNRAVAFWAPLSNVAGEQEPLLLPLLFCLRDWLLAVPPDLVPAMASDIRASFDLLVGLATETVDEKLKSKANRFLEPLDEASDSLEHYGCDQIEAMLIRVPKSAAPGAQPKKKHRSGLTPLLARRRRHHHHHHNHHFLHHQPDTVSVSSDTVSMDSVAMEGQAQLQSAAEMILMHLSHFYMTPQTSDMARVDSRVSEHHGVSKAEEFGESIFGVEGVQFFALGAATLVSFVELAGSARVVLRDPTGKYAWDAESLTEAREVSTEQSTVPVVSEKDSAQSEWMDTRVNLEHLAFSNLLQEEPLTLEADAEAGQEQKPAWILDELAAARAQTHEAMSHQEDQGLADPAIFREDSTPYPSLRRVNSVMQKTPSRCRKLLHQFGLLSWGDPDRSLAPLRRSEQLIRELKHLDKSCSRETHKVAVVLICQGQSTKIEILTNGHDDGSPGYSAFVGGLGATVELDTHEGYSGNLRSSQFPGCVAPYHATETVEAFFHVATLMSPARTPTAEPGSRQAADEVSQKRWKHVGNDSVLVVWNDSDLEYRPSMLQTKFAEVTLVIYPLKNHLYRVQVRAKQALPLLGPLFDGAVVDAASLPILVRETSINAGRMLRIQALGSEPYYNNRCHSLRRLVKKHRQDTTFDGFELTLLAPTVVPRKRLSTADREHNPAAAAVRPSFVLARSSTDEQVRQTLSPPRVVRPRAHSLGERVSPKRGQPKASSPHP